MENCIIIDWLSATIKMTDELPFLYGYHTLGIENYFMELLGIPRERFEVSNGVKGFDKRYWFDGINIHTPSDKMPFCWLEMSGSGCRAFESYSTYPSWDYLFRNLLDWCRITRLDLAYDDHSGVLPMPEMIQDTLDQSYVSKARSHEVIIKLNDSSPDRECSIYHGSQSSAIMIRIYDKARQLDRVGDHWIRSELQLRDDRAHKTVQALLDHAAVGDVYFGILNNYFRYIEPCDTDSNRWRWPLKNYWADFAASVAPIALFESKGIEYNLQNLDHFVFYQAGNSIQSAIKIYGLDGFVKKLKEIRPYINNPQQIALVEKLAASGQLAVGKVTT